MSRNTATYEFEGKEYTVWTENQLSGLNRNALTSRCRTLRDSIGQDRLPSMPHHPEGMVAWLLQVQGILMGGSGGGQQQSAYSGGSSVPQSANGRGASFDVKLTDEAGSPIYLTTIDSGSSVKDLRLKIQGAVLAAKYGQLVRGDVVLSSDDLLAPGYRVNILILQLIPKNFRQLVGHIAEGIKGFKASIQPTLMASIQDGEYSNSTIEKVNAAKKVADEFLAEGEVFDPESLLTALSAMVTSLPQDCPGSSQMDEYVDNIRREKKKQARTWLRELEEAIAR